MKISNFNINRDLDKGTYDLEQVFPGLRDLEIVIRIFSKHNTDKIKIKIIDSGLKYMRVLDENGVILVSMDYLKKADEKFLYLDILHELVHVRQHFEKKELYNKNVEYVDNPTEIEAYKLAVDEARKIGMTDREIRNYLKVEWINEEQFNRLLNVLKVS